MLRPVTAGRRGAALLALTVVLTVAAIPGRAAADPGVCQDYQPDCHIGDQDSHHQGGNNGGNHDGGGGDGGPCYALSQYGQVEVPCYDPDLGVYQGDNCWLSPFIGPTTGPGGPEPGAWYNRYCMSPHGSFAVRVWIVDGAVPTVSPEQLARRALATIRLLGADIQLAPRPGGSGLVGMPVWMWTDVRNDTWGPIGASATDAGLTVTITARAASIAWNMGDGTTVTCDNPGTPYEPRYGDSPSPTCGHVYPNPSTGRAGGTYPVSATTTWQVAWTGGGASGVITTLRLSQTTVRIGELVAVTE